MQKYVREVCDTFKRRNKTVFSITSLLGQIFVTVYPQQIVLLARESFPSPPALSFVRTPGCFDSNSGICEQQHILRAQNYKVWKDVSITLSKDSIVTFSKALGIINGIKYKVGFDYPLKEFLLVNPPAQGKADQYC